MSSPKAAWLKKRTCTMGKTRWQARFFVLLETELRYYKDEYAVTPNYIWDLRDIIDIEQYKTVNCLSLEPRVTHGNGYKPLMLQFLSGIEMQEWLDHLMDRCSLQPPPSPPPPSLGRRRGIILSSLTIDINDNNQVDHTIIPSLESSSPSSTISTSSSASSLATLVDQDITSSSPPPLPPKNTTDETASPTYLKYKNQFRL